MSGPLTDARSPTVAEKDSKAIQVRLRPSHWTRRYVLVAGAVVVVVVAGVLYNRPAHSYEVSENSKTWAADVQIALSEGGAGGAVAPVGPLRDLPGVGKIAEVIVDKAALRKGTAVLFLTGLGGDYSGLAYLDGFPLPPDSCNAHLSSPWWQIAPLNDKTRGCPRGFDFTGGG